MNYLGKIYNQFQQLEQASLIDNQVKIEVELSDLLSCIPSLQTDMSCHVLQNRQLNEFTFVINKDEQLQQIPQELINNIKQAIKIFFSHYSVKTQVVQSENRWLIELPNPTPHYAISIISYIAKHEINLPAGHLGLYSTFIGKIKIKSSNKEQMEKLSLAISEVAEGSQEMFSSKQKSARKT